MCFFERSKGKSEKQLYIIDFLLLCFRWWPLTICNIQLHERARSTNLLVANLAESSAVLSKSTHVNSRSWTTKIMDEQLDRDVRDGDRGKKATVEFSYQSNEASNSFQYEMIRNPCFKTVFPLTFMPINPSRPDFKIAFSFFFTNVQIYFSIFKTQA